MEAFEDIRQKDLVHLTGEIGTPGRRLVELGWSRDQVLVYAKQLLNHSTDTASGDSNSGPKEDRP